MVAAATCEQQTRVWRWPSRAMRSSLLVLLLSEAWAVVGAWALGLPTKGLSLWIDEDQVEALNGIPMEIYAILDGHVLPYILDPDFQKYLPVIPPEVEYINFTWKSGIHKYHYAFEHLCSYDVTMLDHPSVSIAVSGHVPRTTTVFSVFVPCSGIAEGAAAFGIGIVLRSRRGRVLPGSPVRLRLRKQCRHDFRPALSYSGSACADGGTCGSRISHCFRTHKSKHWSYLDGRSKTYNDQGHSGRLCPSRCRRCRVISDESGRLVTRCTRTTHAQCLLLCPR